MVEEEGHSIENLSVAWFIEFVFVWFELAVNRHPVMALSRSDVTMFDEAISYLYSVIDAFKSVRIGNGSWKPVHVVQTGLVALTSCTFALFVKSFSFAHLHPHCFANSFMSFQEFERWKS
jgi:hypothetical protein